MILPIISEEEYLAHYGRKGMKWYQHIYGDDKPKGTGRSRGSSSSSEQTNKKPNQTGTKSKYKSDEESDKALEDRFDFDNGRTESSEPDFNKVADFFNEVEKKSGDLYSDSGRAPVSKGFKKNREERAREIEKLEDSELGKRHTEDFKEWMDYQVKYLDKMFVGSKRKKEGQALKEKMEKSSKEFSKKMREIEEKYDDELMGVVLTDMGYRDTKKGRKMVSDLWLWYSW